MNIKKYIVCTAVAVIAFSAAGFILGFSSKDKVEDKNNEKVEIKKAEYTGSILYNSVGFADTIKEADYDIEGLHELTGSVSLNNIGFSYAIQNYSEYMASEEVSDEEAKDVVQQLDEATQTVPKESVITGYTKLGISNAYEYLNVRRGPSTDDKIIGKMPGYCACEILEEVNGWYKIKSGEVEGYVYAGLMVTGYDANVLAMEHMEEKLVVTTDILNVREEPNTNCSIGTQVSNGEYLEIIEDEVNGWYKININNLIGYVSAEFVEKRNVLPTAVAVKEVVATAPTNQAPDVDVSGLSDEVSQQAVDLINYSMQFLGNPYVLGGNSLTNGTDCSGFVKLVFEQFGYNLPRSSGEYLYVGTPVPLNKIKPGDILLYMYGGSIGHVALYIGNGQIIHASTPSTGIVIGNAYYTAPCAAVRVIP